MKPTVVVLTDNEMRTLDGIDKDGIQYLAQEKGDLAVLERLVSDLIDSLVAGNDVVISTSRLGYADVSSEVH